MLESRLGQLNQVARPAQFSGVMQQAATEAKPMFGGTDSVHFSGTRKLRLEWSDSAITMCSKLAEGNQEAYQVVMKIYERASVGDRSQNDTVSPKELKKLKKQIQKGQAQQVDLQSGFRPLLNLDSMGVYGQRITRLYNDVCGRNVEKTVGVLLAAATGMISEDALNHAIDNNGKGINVDQLVTQIRQKRGTVF